MRLSGTYRRKYWKEAPLSSMAVKLPSSDGDKCSVPSKTAARIKPVKLTKFTSLGI